MNTTINTTTNRRILYSALGTLAWLIFSQKGLRMTMSDRRARKFYARAAVKVHTDKVNIEGRHLHFAWTGNATLPTLLFLHGSPKSWTYFKDYLKDDQLLERFRLVALDRPGYGQSDFGNSERLTDQAVLIGKLLDTISNGQPVYVVGHSMGAPVAVSITTLRPDIIKGIVLAGGALDPKEEKIAGWRKIFMVPPFNYLLPGALRPANKEMYFLKKDLFRIQSKYSQVNCPVILVHAKDDRIVTFRQSKTAGKHFTNADQVKLVSFEKGGHFLPTKKFTQFRDLLLQALEPHPHRT